MINNNMTSSPSSSSSLASVPVPVYTTVKEIYPDLEVAIQQSKRLDDLSLEYLKRFGRKPEYIVRAPGRVNLIGEHIDYALFGVFPTAIERDILIACSLRPNQPDATDGLIVADNLNPKYPRQEFVAKRDGNLEWQLGIDKRELRWESYVKAGYYGVLSQFFAKEEDGEPKGFDMLFTATVPAGSGVSSSAAIVVASTLAFLVMNDKLSKVSKGDLIRMAVLNESRVGVNSGGMDQSASILSSPQSALYISFYPQLTAQAVPMPPTNPPAVFILANSLVLSEKHISAKWQYNLRVVETLAGARILALHLQIQMEKDEKITFREVLERWWKLEGKRDILREDELREALKGLLESRKLQVLKAGEEEIGFTLEEMVKATGLSLEEFTALYLTFKVQATHFQLYNRALHVFTEALRVLEFRDLLLQSASTAPALLTNPDESTKVLNNLGRLMNESQESCNTLFDCSCPELNELTKLAGEAGAYGSRLTGAGWGGCTVSLVPQPLVDTFIKKLKSQYAPYKNLQGQEFEQVVFATKPGSGAYVFTLE